MNQPEYSAAILYDDTAFEIGDMTEIELIFGKRLIGQICEIEKDGFSIDVSERYNSKIYTYRYSDVKEMKMIDIPK